MRLILRRLGASAGAAISQVAEDLQYRGLAAFDRNNPDQRSAAVKSTVEASLRYLKATDPEAQPHYDELAVFPDDEPIPLEVVMLADEVYFYGPEQCLVISIDLPVVGQVIEATPAEPYLCLRLVLDPGQLSALMMELGAGATRNQRVERLKLGLSVSAIDPALLDAAVRLARLLETPKDIPILAPLVEREILYRLLSGEYGDRLRQIATADHRLVAVNRAISWLKRNYTVPFRIETIAREARLSPSALHHSFKSVTAMSPLQYQNSFDCRKRAG